MTIKIIPILITTIIMGAINNAYSTDLPLSLPQNTQIPIPQAIPQGLPPDINKLSTIPLVSNNVTSSSLSKTDNLQFNQIALPNLLSLLFAEIETRNYVLSPKVMSDSREVSFRYTKKKDGNLDIFLSTFLKSLGYELTNRNGVLYVDEPQQPPQKKPEDFNYYVYIPKFQRADYLISNVRPYFHSAFTAQVKGIATDQKINENDISPTSAAALIDKSQKTITFKYETEKQKEVILSLLNQLDVATKNLVIKAYIYEVQYSSKDGSALGLVLNLASQKLNINLGSTSNPLDNFVKFSSNTLNLLFSQISQDSRFKIVSNPLLRVKDGKSVSFNVGASVPTLGATTYQNGTAINSTDYKDTGLLFKLTPTIQNDSVEIDLQEEISEVVNTTTGVNNSPSFTKRSLSSVFDTKQNEVILLAGLTNNKTQKDKSRPFILPFFTNDIESKDNTEILIFFEVSSVSSVEKVPSEAVNSSEQKPQLQ